MESLFTTDILIDGQPVAYAVSFHDEQYEFTPNNSKGIFFSLRREEDEWHTNDAITETVKDNAIDTLDKYLLSQH